MVCRVNCLRTRPPTHRTSQGSVFACRDTVPDELDDGAKNKCQHRPKWRNLSIIFVEFCAVDQFMQNAIWNCMVSSTRGALPNWRARIPVARVGHHNHFSQTKTALVKIWVTSSDMSLQLNLTQISESYKLNKTSFISLTCPCFS